MVSSGTMEFLNRFPRKHSFVAIHGALLLLLHAVCLLLTNEALRTSKAFEQSSYLIPVFIINFLLTIVLLVLFRDTFPRIGVLCLKLLILMLAIIPLGYPTPLKAALLCTFILEASLVLSSPWDIIVELAVLVFALGTQQDRKAWDTVVQGASFDEYIGLLLFPLLVMSLSWGFKVSARSLQTMRSEVERLLEWSQRIIMANVSFQELAQEVEEASSDRERKRISREIHDIVGYTLTNQYMAMEASIILLDKDSQRERLRDLLETAKDQTQEGLTEVRASLHKLRNHIPQSVDFLEHILHICKTFQKVTSVQVNFETSIGQHQVPLMLEKEIFRMVQAGLTNSFLHGRASRINVDLHIREDILKLSIQDNGTGAGNISEGIGLTGMRERVILFNGTLGYSTCDNGFLVEAAIPISGLEMDQ